MAITSPSASAVVHNIYKHPDESKTRIHRLSKLPDDGDPWAPNNLLTPDHQLDPGGPSNRQEAPAPTN